MEFILKSRTQIISKLPYTMTASKLNLRITIWKILISKLNNPLQTIQLFFFKILSNLRKSIQNCMLIPPILMVLILSLKLLKYLFPYLNLTYGDKFIKGINSKFDHIVWILSSLQYSEAFWWFKPWLIDFFFDANHMEHKKLKYLGDDWIVILEDWRKFLDQFY